MTLVGPPGTGKSRLARELIRSWDQRADGKIISVTASQFAADLAEASAAGAIRQFQIRYRNEVTLLVCEDLQSLAGRNESQHQLTLAIDDVIAQGGCVLLSSTSMPSEIPKFSRRLANRIQGGLCVNVSLPKAASRKKLLLHFLETGTVQLSPAEVDHFSKTFEVSARELIGLLEQVKVVKRSNGKGNLIEAIEDLGFTPKHSLKEIARAVTKEFETTLAELRGPKRSKTIRTARHLAMHFARQRTDATLKQIGEYFGRGNHSTVIHACNKIDEELKTNTSLAFRAESIVAQLEKKI